MIDILFSEAAFTIYGIVATGLVAHFCPFLLPAFREVLKTVDKLDIANKEVAAIARGAGLKHAAKHIEKREDER